DRPPARRRRPRGGPADHRRRLPGRPNRLRYLDRPLVERYPPGRTPRYCGSRGDDACNMDARTHRSGQAGHHHAAEQLAVNEAVAAPGTTTRRPLRLLLPALIVVVLAALDLTVIAPILPSVLVDLQINTAEADRYVWIVSGYLRAYVLTI